MDFIICVNDNVLFSAQCRKPDIMADAAYAILRQSATLFTGNFAIDEDILRKIGGIRDFGRYSCVEGVTELAPDFFLDDIKSNL